MPTVKSIKNIKFMKIFKPSTNNVIVTIEHRFIAHLYNMIRTANMNPGSQINPADYVNIIGEIVAIPREITIWRRGYEGCSTKDIRVGDKAIFRYDVVFDFVEKTDGSAAFKNTFWYEGREWWNCDIQKLFAVIRGGEIIMVNGYCMIEDMEKQPAIIIPQSSRQSTFITRGTLTHVGNNITTLPNITAKPGDTVYYNPNKIQHYKINGKEFGIIQQHHICGKSVNKYAGAISM
jgi:co-chaperonin GroES (HSP10)